MRYISLLLAVPALSAAAQAVTFDEDNLQRGYYDRPWQRYEAEPGRCAGNAEFLLPPEEYTQEPLQAEASNQTAAALKAKGDYVEWTVDRPGRGLTIRFSLPDSGDGRGVSGDLVLSADGNVLQTVTVDSRHAWQYTPIAYQAEKYPDNIPSADKFARMRFDEAYVLLDSDIPSGTRLRLAKADDSSADCVIDFVELEPVAPALTFDRVDAADKVMYDGSVSLGSFIAQNPGKTIFIPAGTYSLSRQLHITAAGTKLVGAGMWYTRLYFSAPSDSRDTYSARGIHCSVSDVLVEGMSIDTANDKRYFENNPSYQVGKGLNGNWGSNSTVRDVRIDHFECGGWITGARGLTVERCRFRNNYADGINLANNSTGCRVSRCSFRNNGDDDMASWSTGDFATDNEFSYCTAENNWRASSLGFFGGCRGRAHHIAVYDAMEAGVRVVCDFPGTGFSANGCFELSDITIRRSGAKQGVSGTNGGFWGDSAASLQIGAGPAYDIRNLDIHDIDIYDSRFDAVSIHSSGGKRVENLNLRCINIYRVDGYCYGVNIGGEVRGSGTYGDIHAEGVVEPIMADIPAGFDFVALPSSGVGDVSMCCHADAPACYCIDGQKTDRPVSGRVYIVKTGGEVKKILIR